VERGGRILTREWPKDPDQLALLAEPRDDVLLEEAVESTGTGADTNVREFVQADGPFATYRRKLETSGDVVVETTTYSVIIPWFGWLFRWPVRRVLSRRLSYQSWWAPPDRLDTQQVLVLGLLAAASMSAAFVNTLFTQTVNFAADEFGVDDTGIGISGAVVRGGILIALPAAVIADRIGRRRVIVFIARRAGTEFHNSGAHSDSCSANGYCARVPRRRGGR